MNLEWTFLLKKIISLGLKPLPLGILLALIALVYIYKKNIKKAKKYLSFSLLWMFLISSPPLGNILLSFLENNYPPLQKMPQNIEYILLLGGDRERRAWEALRLYQKIPNVKIITSGYAIKGVVSEAKVTAIILERSGIKKEDILSQGEAKDTEEEAMAMKKRVGEKPFILITSAYHMPRAMKFFKNKGLNPIAAPTDFNNPQEDTFLDILQAKQLKKTERAWHEYWGLLWLWIKEQLK